MGRPAAFLAAVIAAALAGAGAVAQSAVAPLPQAVKAVYLMKLPLFVEWPPAAEGGADFRICVVGPDPFGGLLDRAAGGVALKRKPVIVTRVATLDLNLGCQVMFLGGATSIVRQELAATRGHPVLTVTDDPKSPGVIDFVMDRGRVRFRVDNDAAAANGLAISSKLLELAVSVKMARGASR